MRDDRVGVGGTRGKAHKWGEFRQLYATEPRAFAVFNFCTNVPTVAKKMDVNDQAILRSDHIPIGTTPAMQWGDPNVVAVGTLGQMVQLFMRTQLDQRES